MYYNQWDHDYSRAVARYHRTVAPSADAISLARAKAHLRVDFTDDDDLIQDIIDTVVQLFDSTGKARDGVLGCAMVTQTWVLQTQHWVFPFRERNPRLASDYRIWIEHGPVQTVSGIKVWTNDVQVDWPTDQWRLGFQDTRAFITTAPGGSWPSFDLREDAFEVTFTTGYGDTSDDVPAPLRAAMLLMIGHLYANREQVIASASRAVVLELPRGVDALIAPYKVQAF